MKTSTVLEMDCSLQEEGVDDLFFVLVGLRTNRVEVNPPVTVMSVILIEFFHCTIFSL